MKYTRHRTMRSAAALVATTAAAVCVAGVVAPAQSADLAGSRITVNASDADVRSGEQFRLRGILKSEGAPVAGATVRVKTYRDGAWLRLRGAVVSTNDEGRYRVRVVLRMKGERALRVVAVPKEEDIRKARADIVVDIR
jgi:hypothetical protein